MRSIETPASWRVAWAVLAILSVIHGTPLVLVVALKSIAADLEVPRSVPALAAALQSFGAGLGGIMLGWIADRVGARAMAVFGALAVAAGLLVATQGGTWGLYLGFGVLVGLLGNGALGAPLLIYVSRWFDRRRGTALALVSAGQYVAGTLWPTLFERGLEHWGWRATAWAFAAVVAGVTIPIALLFLRPPPVIPEGGHHGGDPIPGARVLGLPPNLVLFLLSLGIFLCCVPMAQPTVHLVSFCTDLGISPTRSAAMLSVLLACAFVSRQFWGWLADRIGGLRAILLGSICQTIALALFLSTQDEAGLFAVAAAFGLGFAGLVPNYILAARALFPAAEAGWRIPLMMFGGLLGMAVGGWMGGLVYDMAGSYAPSFAIGVAANIANIAVIGFLVRKDRRPSVQVLATA
ncbi:MAG: MFS transporter [Alphaproteobacteria bacterium]|nr:MFS transporter [Alphaproteobacteria bacterium]